MYTSANRRYNLPHHEKVAVVFVVQDGVSPVPKDVVIYPRDRLLQTILALSCNMDPMCYPLLFPCGDAGSHREIVHVSERATRVYNLTTMLQFYAYRIAKRNNFSPILHSKKFYQQYVDDAMTFITLY